MKKKDVYYVDDGILVSGYVVKRRFRRAIFYPYTARCGFSYQILSRKDKIVDYTKTARRKYYKETYPAGAEVRLLGYHKKSMPVAPGTVCTVISVDNTPIIRCECNGKKIAIYPEIDAFQLVEEG